MAKSSTTSPDEMSFLDHLEELRWHLIRSTLAVVIIGIVAFVFSRFIFDVIIFGPLDMDFPTYKIFCDAATSIGMESDFCKEKVPFTIQSRTMSGQFSADIWTAIWAGLIIGFPYILFELWKFISPGLYEKERKHSKGFIFIASLLFFLGVLFGYYIVAPLSINFLGSYQVSELVLNEFDLDNYIGLLRSAVLACGIIFELPIIIYFLTKVGLVTPEIMKKYRKIALVIVLIISAVITPPDVTSQIIVAIPVLILYQASIYISARVLKSEAKKEAKRKKNNVKSS
ncbi:twin-arginine translocase subunit TatC [Maribacter cobaltidurans]|uniref:Sec-independent protein translocase protein TatC n=1 Tax=Maribacter cobaltidurans TaxID=1178778 RepID=A0A223V0M7_9FLAO|nr:twin-arginine translocase subunit TatC [Maribacter cobaltidurans]ASV29023.1 twin-arginine translocase subunit TatC [Maribacter cobaltidurans]GGD72557.1 Sec-independent protein translocase protein TatC [Maribacter cobaltidurans]